MAFDWAGLLLDLVSDVEIPIGSADDKSESNQDVTFQYGENMPYLENLLGYEMYGSNWAPPPSNNAVPTPTGAQPGSTPGPTGGSTGGSQPSESKRPAGAAPQPEFQWDLTPGAGQGNLPQMPQGEYERLMNTQQPPDGTVPLPNDPTQRVPRIPPRIRYGGGGGGGRYMPYMF